MDEKFDKTLSSTGFVINEADRCVYYRYGGGAGVKLCLYVDDILILAQILMRSMRSSLLYQRVLI